ILGVQRVHDEDGAALRIEPCLPLHWNGFELEYRFGRSLYRIACVREQDVPDAQVIVDGEARGDARVPLADDGRPHDVRVIVGTPATVTRGAASTEPA